MSLAPRENGLLDSPDGAGIYYEVHGEGEDMVIVPYAVAFSQALHPLSDRRTVIFYDMRSRGRSETIDDPSRLSLDHDVEDLEAVRRRFRAERVAVIGFSYLGGMVARYAMRYPDRVWRLVQMGAMAPRQPAPYAQDRAAVMRLLDPAAVTRVEQMRQEGVDAKDPEAFCQAYWDAHFPLYTATPDAAKRLRHSVDLGCGLLNEHPAAFMRTLGAKFGATSTWDWRADSAAIRAPSLVIHGRQDHVAPAAGGREWAASIPDARFLEVPDAGHMLWAEQPEVFFSAVDGFLDGPWPDGALKLEARSSAPAEE